MLNECAVFATVLLGEVEQKTHKECLLQYIACIRHSYYSCIMLSTIFLQARPSSCTLFTAHPTLLLGSLIAPGECQCEPRVPHSSNWPFPVSPSLY